MKKCLILMLILCPICLSAQNEYFFYPSIVPNVTITLNITGSSKADAINKTIDSALACTTAPQVYCYSLKFNGMSGCEINDILKKIHSRWCKYMTFDSCSFKELPVRISLFEFELTGLAFHKCDNFVSFGNFQSSKETFEILFDSCKISTLPRYIDDLQPMLHLMLKFEDDFSGFDMNLELAKFSKKKNITDLLIKYNKMTSFPDTLFSLASLKRLFVFGSKYVVLPRRFNELCNLSVLVYTDENDTPDNEFNCYLRRLIPVCIRKNYINPETDYEIALCGGEYGAKERFIKFNDSQPSGPYNYLCDNKDINIPRGRINGKRYIFETEKSGKCTLKILDSLDYDDRETITIKGVLRIPHKDIDIFEDTVKDNHFTFDMSKIPEGNLVITLTDDEKTIYSRFRIRRKEPCKK